MLGYNICLDACLDSSRPRASASIQRKYTLYMYICICIIYAYIYIYIDTRYNVVVGTLSTSLEVTYYPKTAQSIL